MTTQILFFGRLREAAGGADRTVDLPETVNNRSALIDFLAKDDPYLHSALNKPEIRLCVDKQILTGEATFSAPEEIAFLSPFSGG
jgi:molybdopterin synthase sulfur carrier subunit